MEDAEYLKLRVEALTEMLSGEKWPHSFRQLRGCL